MKKVGIIVLIIILMILVISFIKVLVFAIHNNNWNWFLSFGSSKELRKNEYIRKEESIDLADIDKIELSFKSSDLNVHFTEDSKMRVVQYSTKELNEDELFKVNKTSSTINISEKNKIYFFYIGFIDQKAYDVYIPKEYEKNLKISLVSGDIEVDESLKFEDLTISSTSGDINMGDIEAKSIGIETISGDIRLQNLKEDNLKLKTTSGDILVESIEGEISLKTTSGDITINNAIGEIEAKTTSGKIEIGKIEGSIDMQSVSGNIKSDDFKIIGNSNIKTTSGDVKVYLNEESNCEIFTDTVSGNITLPNRRNVMGHEPYSDLKIKTVSGNIRLEK